MFISLKCIYCFLLAFIGTTLKSAALEEFAPPPAQRQHAISSIKQITPYFDLFCVDMHGVLIVKADGQEKVLPEAWDAVNQLSLEKKMVFLVTNFFGTSGGLQEYLSHQENIDQNIDCFDKTITAGDFFEQVLRKHNLYGKKARAWGREFFQPSSCNACFEIVEDDDDDYEVLICSRAVPGIKEGEVYDISKQNPEWEEELRQAAKKGKIFFTCSMDPALKEEINGEVRVTIAPGYFAQVFARFGGRVIAPGKPGRAMLEAIFHAAPHIPRHRMIMIGDSWDTDMAFGLKDIAHLLVKKTGNASLDSPMICTKREQLPDYEIPAFIW